MALRNPYTVGGVVRGPNFYGRTALIRTVLDGNDRAVWVVGNRRIGKTSLLRRLEELANADGRIAFHISMEASDTLDDLAQGFVDDMDTGDGRLGRLGLATTDIQGRMPHAILRILDRQARERGVEVLLLLDESEALIRIAERDGDAMLKDIRREIQRSEALRVVLAATKRLEELNDLCRTWDTSPFLYGVTPRYLGRLERAETVALICQAQSSASYQVAEAVADAVIAATDGHPFLTQWLCDRLWTEQGLRAPTVDDLIPDANLIDLFQRDYNHLAPIERRILRCLASVESLDEAGLLTHLDNGIPAVQLRYLVQTLAQLCYVRRTDLGYCAGNRLLQNWLQFCEIAEPTPPMTDAAAVDQADEEQQAIITVLAAHKRRLNLLAEQRALKGVDTPPEVLIEIEDIKVQINELEAKLVHLRSRHQ